MKERGVTFCCAEPSMTFDELLLCKTVAWMDWRSRHPKGAGAPRIGEVEKFLQRRAANERYCHIDS
jgi:hypothetical protein